ncbi:uncharacterized protein LOC122663298 [Telopea speciosissima]|uniref:uncharacterized protein LOC122663298 n=1 Tax=Telopea speciosissima TaxID=54955 RepID=UPI001CC71C9C|nr:uncharacterized protein LOC122663298 [Telopea speciosissima]
MDCIPSSSIGTTSQHKKRGHNRSIKTEKMKPGEVRKVLLNVHGQGINDITSEFITWMGTLVRNGNNLPYNYHDWRKVPVHYKEALWNKMQDKYEVLVLGRKWAFAKMGLQWKAFKRELRRKFFDKSESIDEVIEKCPAMVPLDQWKSLIDIWMSAKNKKLRNDNKKNRQLQKMNHTCGRRSYAQRFYLKKTENLEGVEPTRLQMFVETHTRKDDTPVDPVSAQKMRDLYEDLNKVSEENKNNLSVHETIFTKNLGKDTHGRVRLRGVGGIGILLDGIFGGVVVTLIMERENRELKNQVSECFLDPEPIPRMHIKQSLRLFFDMHSHSENTCALYAAVEDSADMARLII